VGEDPDRIRREIEQTRAEMGETVDALSYKTDVKARAKDTIRDKKESVMSVKDRVVGATPDSDEVKQKAGRAKSVAEENPLGLAVGALAAGFLAGMLFPSTRVEDEKLGRISDDVIDRAKETGQEALERGKQVAQEAAQSAQETVKESGAEHADELKSTAQEHAASVRS
jgi:gas vesicle protein